MNLRYWLTAATWMIRDTLRQSLASGLAWWLFGLSTVCILLCLSASVSGHRSLAPPGGNPDFLPRLDPEARDLQKAEQSGVTVVDGSLGLAFGAIRIPLARDVRSAVHFIELILAGGVADTLGLLLALVWTAGFLPRFLEPQAVSVLLVKPLPRWGLLLGKYVGVLAFVFLQATYLVAGTWLALGLRTGVWDATYLLSIPLLLLHFGIFYSFSALLATCTRSTVVCVFGSIAFWGICWGINYGRYALSSADVASHGSFSPALVRLTDLGYWLFPKPIDLGRLVFETLGAGSHFRLVFEKTAGLSLELSVLTSVLFAVYVLFAAGRQFTRMDY